MMDKEYNENEEGMGGHWGHMGWGHMGMGCCGKKNKKEFKLAMLEKKEKMVEAKLEFIRKMKELVKKESDSEESK
jgi:hypothetical protein